MDLRHCFLTLCLLAYSVADTEHLSYAILEEEPPGTYIGNILTDSLLSATYADEITRILKFNFLSKGLLTEYFELQENTGVLKTKVSIDREEVCPKLVVCVLDIDIAIQPPEYFEVIKLHVTIYDVNDVTPEFDLDELEKSLVESAQPGILFPILTANDFDSPENGIVSYELRGGGNKFDITYSTLDNRITDIRLVLLKEVDREAKDMYTLELFAYDGGNPALIGTQIIHLTITDANDNAPQLAQHSREIEVPEDTVIGTSLLNIEAIDDDIGKNGKLHYYFDGRTERLYGSLFHLNRDNGTLTLNSELDFERQDLYSLKLNVNDQGAIKLTASAIVIIQVLDVNDNKPIIRVNDDTVDGVVTVTLIENQPADEFVAFISVEDYDQNSNKITDCELQQKYTDSPLFRMDAFMLNGYKIVTNEPLDREKEHLHDLTVSCTDRGNPPLSSFVRLEVKVRDVNDNAPEFTHQPYVFSIEENNRNNAFIGQIRARDKDMGPNGDVSFYFCAKTDFPKDLSLDERTGVLIALAHFDHESVPVVHVCVEARDHGHAGPLKTMTDITINIIDVNDNQPEFNQSSYSFTIMENTLPANPIGKVYAHDFDSPPYNIFIFKIETNPYLEIDLNTGVISLKKEFDREKTPTYTVSAFVSSPEYLSHTDIAQITIQVLDENDNAPDIYSPLPYTNLPPISNHVPIGYNVTQVKAFDKDSGNNALLNFTLVEIFKQGSFKIDPANGIISTARSFKEISTTERFQVRVTVRDNGENPKDSVTIFDVVVNASIPYRNVVMQSSVAFMRQEVHLILIAVVAAFILVLLILLIVCILCLRGKREHETSEKHGYWPAEKEELYVVESKRENEDQEDDGFHERIALTSDSDANSSGRTELYETSLDDEFPPLPPDDMLMHTNNGVLKSNGIPHRAPNGISHHHTASHRTFSPPVSKYDSLPSTYRQPKSKGAPAKRHVTFEDHATNGNAHNIRNGSLIKNPGILMDGSDGTFV